MTDDRVIRVPLQDESADAVVIQSRGERLHVIYGNVVDVVVQELSLGT
jgi:hypothetical protein